MTTIGTAVLQIIPSLKGVTDAIEKQIDGKVVEVKVAPKVDKAAADATGRETRAGVEKHTKQVTVQPKVDQAATKKAGKEVGESIAKEAKTAVSKADIGKGITDNLASSVKKSSTGTDLAKVIFEGLADGVKQGLGGGGGKLGDNIVDDITDSVKSAAKKNKVGAALGGEFTDSLIDSLSKSLRGGNVGKTVTDALNGLGADISGPVTAITGSLAPLKDALSAFKDNDIASGVQGTADGLKQLEDVGVPEGLADTMSQLADPLEKIASGSKAEKVQGIADGLIVMAPAIEDMTGLDLSGVVGNLEKISAVAGSFAIAAEGLVALKGAALALGAGPVIAALSAVSVPLVAIAGVAAALGITSYIGYKTKQEMDKAAADFESQQKENAANNRVPAQVGFIPPPAPPGVPNQAPLPVAPPANLPDAATPTLFPGYHLENGKWVVNRAAGGPITGPGGPTSDVIPVWASNGEFIVNAAAAQKNLALLEFINSGKMPGYKGGGTVGPDVQAAQALVGTPYSKDTRFDCSGAVARVIDRALGLPETGLMTTKTAAEWLAARGFKLGTGGPGAISVGWYDHGPGENDGHMAMTLSDGTNAEAGGKNSVFTVGAGASGANSPLFDHHMFLPLAVSKTDPAALPVSGEGPAGDAPAGNAGAGNAGGAALPSSISGLSSFGLDTLGAGAGKTGAGSDLSLFGKAAGAAVSGQVQSALGVFGVGDAPPFLQAAGKLISGIKIGGKGLLDGGLASLGQGPAGSSAAPLSARSTATGTLPPDGVPHGDQAGQQPGPQTVYNIRTATVEDAFLRAKRLEDERIAAKLDRH